MTRVAFGNLELGSEFFTNGGYWHKTRPFFIPVLNQWFNAVNTCGDTTVMEYFDRARLITIGKRRGDTKNVIEFGSYAQRGP